MFKLKSISNFKYLQVKSKNFNNIKAYFTTRQGGISKGPFKSLNLGLSTGDSPKNVQKNKDILCNNLNINPKLISKGEQIHGKKVAIIENHGELITGVDGLLTNKKKYSFTNYSCRLCALIFL